MILIGHPHIPSEIFRHITSLSDLERDLRLSEDDEARSRRGRVFWFGASDDREFALSKFCASNKIDFAVMIGSIKECILSAQYMPKYLIVDFRVVDFSLPSLDSPKELGLRDLRASREDLEMSGKDLKVGEFSLGKDCSSSHSLAKVCQNIADSYLFDSKILAVIQSEQEIESLALSHIDGAIFLDALR